MPAGVEEAIVTCTECGLTGRLLRNSSTGALTILAPFADFEALCRKVVPNYVEDCPWWVGAQHAAIQNLKPPEED